MGNVGVTVTTVPGAAGSVKTVIPTVAGGRVTITMSGSNDETYVINIYLKPSTLKDTSPAGSKLDGTGNGTWTSVLLAAGDYYADVKFEAAMTSILKDFTIP